MTPSKDTSRPRLWSGPGYFIALEGIDGTGKSTLARAVAEAVEAKGRRACLTAEPTGGPHGRRIRELAAGGRDAVSVEEETQLFIDDRREHLEQTVKPALYRGEVVITDRYFYSTMAYQGARGLNPAHIEAEHAAWAPAPSLLVLLELPVEVALDRITHKRGSTPDHFEGADYLARVRTLFESFDHPNLMRLDATQSVGELARLVVSAIPGKTFGCR